MSLLRRLLLASAFIFLVLQCAIVYTATHTVPAPADTLIVLGARLFGDQPSTMLRLRLDKTIELYQMGYAPNIIVTGAQGPDEAVSEASAMRSYLISRGLPPECIFLEDHSYSTRQNLTNAKAILLQQGWNSSIIVTNQSHVFRSLLLARQLELQATGAAAPMADNFLLLVKQYLREGLAIPVVLIGS